MSDNLIRGNADTITYLLRDVDGELWRRARARAVIEGRTIRDVLLDLVREYAAGRPQVARESKSKGVRK